MHRYLLRFLLTAFVTCIALLAIAQDPTTKVPATHLTDIPASQLENVHRLSERIYSSGGPNGEAAFETLAKLGIKTIISVDGAPPDLAAAKKQGLKYIHIPLGYDALPREQALLIAKALQQAPGKVLIHCHHGQHRGPAAAAVACVVVDDWTQEQALAWMKQAGTSPNYSQLIQDAGSFQKPLASELARLPANLPESVAPPPLVDAMLKIDERWEQLQAHFKTATTGKPVAWKDTTTTAVKFDEDFRELQRLPAVTKHTAEFQQLTSEMQKSVARLHQELEDISTGKTADRIAARELIASLQQQCMSCHKKYRDKR